MECVSLSSFRFAPLHILLCLEDIEGSSWNSVYFRRIINHIRRRTPYVWVSVRKMLGSYSARLCREILRVRRLYLKPYISLDGKAQVSMQISAISTNSNEFRVTRTSRGGICPTYSPNAYSSVSRGGASRAPQIWGRRFPE